MYTYVSWVGVHIHVCKCVSICVGVCARVYVLLMCMQMKYVLLGC